MSRPSLLLLMILAAFSTISPGQSTPSPQGPEGGTGQGQFRGGPRLPGAFGTITELGADTLTLKTPDGRTVTAKLGTDTRYMKDRQPAKLADFKVGDMVMVRGEESGKDTITAHVVASRSDAGNMREGLGKQFIAGEIKAIDGTKLTILRLDNQTQVIEVDENTSFRKDNQSVTLMDLKPGDHVFGKGELKGGTFVPAQLNVGEMRRMGPPDREMSH